MVGLRVKKVLVAISMVVVGFLGLVSFGAQDAFACTPHEDGNSSFLFIPAWYNGLVDAAGNVCNPSDFKSDNGNVEGVAAFVWRIVLNVMSGVFVIAGVVMVLMFMFGGFKYITARGDVGMMATAQKSLVQTAVGLAICILAVAATNTIMTLVYM